MNHAMTTRRWWTVCSTVLMSLILGACAVQALPPRAVVIGAHETLAVLPLHNATEAAYADRRAQAILLALLQQRGLKATLYPQPAPDNPLHTSTVPSASEAMQWARREGATWALTGTVTEWRYKSGVDGEPAVGVTLQLIEVRSGEVVWSATGARTGWGYQALAAVGQAQIDELLRGVQVRAAPAAEGRR